MAWRGWSWDAQWGPAAVGDRPLLEVLEAALPDEVVTAAIEATGTREHRRRRLPTHLVVTLVVAMGLWASESMRHALAEVVAGWREQPQARRTNWDLPSTAAIKQARQRAGVRLFRVLFHAVAGRIATAKTKGAFLGGLRLMALDGTTLDLADTPANERAFGRPTTHRGHAAAAFPQLRLVALIETGTHALCDVVIRPFRCAELPAGVRLLRSVGPGMLLLWDRGFHSYEMVQRTLQRDAHFLGRTKSNIVLEPTELLSDGSFLAQIYPTPKARRHQVDGIEVRVVEYVLDTQDAPGQQVYRLITSLLDEQAFPAQLLASTYCERWEIETTLDEIKVHQWAHPRPLRSQHPREVVQEVYGLLLAHLAIRTFMHYAAVQGGKDPDRLSFVGALRVLQCAIPRAQRTPRHQHPLFAPSA
jgi:Insertion element 4 transposase N-terminal/Transposase DDE domain